MERFGFCRTSTICGLILGSWNTDSPPATFDNYCLKRKRVIMADSVPPTTGNTSRRVLLRNSLLAGIGVAAANLTIASSASASTESASRPATASARLASLASTADYAVQAGWQWCGKCRGLFYILNGTNGVCPSGGGHNGSSSSNYQLLFGEPSVSAPDIQSNWRWCRKCQGLAFAGNGTSGRCPAGSGHNFTASYNYHLFHDTTIGTLEQPNWRWCSRCQGLYYGPQQSASACPASGRHGGSASYNYVLAYI
ncbi:hypothetical protein GCM10022225_65140 [Plantactinospora mayteni]|uniref:Uncharacterized protein n=1 Tax=Plantactinospora mayteni TaxID=566021 RepID=A0ABQ4F0M3_9ACTN|nr:hypothetical protein [Plantactinospora mayteni]GIH00415.1 hypothetical protein Pma05_69870 [Plantactinospora mayteni]